MRKWIQGIWLVGLLVGLMSSAGCVGGYYVGGPYYDYNYYPDRDVYYYPHGHLYYWHDEQGHWLSGGRLPEHYDLHAQHSEHFRGHTQQPWTEHHPASRLEDHH